MLFMLTLPLRVLLLLLMLPLLIVSCFLVFRRTAGLRRGFTVAVVVAANPVAVVVVEIIGDALDTAVTDVGVVNVILAAIGVGCNVTLPIVCVCEPRLKLIVGAGV